MVLFARAILLIGHGRLPLCVIEKQCNRSLGISRPAACHDRYLTRRYLHKPVLLVLHSQSLASAASKSAGFTVIVRVVLPLRRIRRVAVRRYTVRSFPSIISSSTSKSYVPAGSGRSKPASWKGDPKVTVVLVVRTPVMEPTEPGRHWSPDCQALDQRQSSQLSKDRASSRLSNSMQYPLIMSLSGLMRRIGSIDVIHKRKRSSSQPTLNPWFVGRNCRLGTGGQAAPTRLNHFGGAALPSAS
ncbi:hypothetical protein FHY02_003603 [Sphingomonas sp. BK069]|nr:hypothetical protein [Sphingomonas sp. BK069]